MQHIDLICQISSTLGLLLPSGQISLERGELLLDGVDINLRGIRVGWHWLFR